jgi:hypothetical protein
LVYENFFNPNCDDDACFIKRADACKTAEMQKVIAGSDFSLKTQDCVFEKSVLKVHEAESEVTIGLFEGTSVVCAYSAGDFDSDWISSVSLGLDNCEGSLKDVVEQI